MLRSSSGGSSSAPPPPGRSVALPSTGRRPLVGGLPPPPPGVSHQAAQSSFSQSMAKSMTIEEMRHLHQRALSEAEAKRTELRLVLASRYRELVGSSDEVIKMKERATELHDLVHALPSLMEKLTSPSDTTQETEEKDEDTVQKSQQDISTILLRRNLSRLPRVVYRALDVRDVFEATRTLIELFTLIASKTDAYPLANALSTGHPFSNQNQDVDPALMAQIRMIFLHVQTLPNKIGRMASKNLVQAAAYGTSVQNPALGAQISASALSSLHLLTAEKLRDRAEFLLDKYFDAKTELLVSLLNQLAKDDDNDPTTGNAEEILSKIVLILQYDVILHPYQIFCLGDFPCVNKGDAGRIMQTLPKFDKAMVKARCSKFLTAHLPLIRTKVKSVLMTIAGTTASALGQIRQSLYDKTDGDECMQRLDDNGICTWDEALEGMVDGRMVQSHGQSSRKFSLWSALFSNTFSSLVHSLLSTSFLSVHTRVVSTLRASLANAPPLDSILPHEAYRNALKIATELDAALLKVSDDAHELLVHAEERVESERRLRQSLYVQTCEIMGRLVCELRRMAVRGKNDSSDATKELIIGRLCYLLKFRLTSLSTLLDPKSSPAAMHSTSGMISYVDLKSSFELADDNEDGLITFEEALEAVESAFSGTQFNGADMIRETLLILTADKDQNPSSSGPSLEAPMNVTLSELTLLTARGLRHDESGAESALGTVQKSLDDIVNACFREWADAVLSTSVATAKSNFQDYLQVASTVSEAEWRRLFVLTGTNASQSFASGVTGNISPFVVGYLLDVSSILDRTTCPSDSLVPVPSSDYAVSLGIVARPEESIPTLMDTIRWTLLRQSLVRLTTAISVSFSSQAGLENSCRLALLQLHLDISFIQFCYFDRNQHGFGPAEAEEDCMASVKPTLETLVTRIDKLLRGVIDPEQLVDKKQHIFDVCDLFVSSFLGADSSPQASVMSDIDTNSGYPGSTGAALICPPLVSSRRFVLLPVQADRSLSDLQRGKYAKEKQRESRQEPSSGGVMSSGLGFFSSMLKKK